MKEIETDNNVGGKTLEEIKKGLECCQHDPYNGLCRCDNGCPYRLKDKCDQLRKDALALIEQLERERDAAVDDLRSVIIDVDKGCILCAHYHECKGEACPHFESGVEAVHTYGSQIYDFEWTCELFEYGTCAEMENTPCNGCDFQNHWEWRGVKEEKDDNTRRYQEWA